MTSCRSHFRCILIATLLVAAPVAYAAEDESTSDASTKTPATEKPATETPATETPATETAGRDPHPLSWTVKYATSRADYIREKIRDYTCRLIKRENIEGELQEHQFLLVEVRCEQVEDGKVVKPLAVFMQYLAPARLKDRRVLYIEGEHGGKVLVRKGGSALSYLRLSIDPYGTAARRESNYPVTDIGFDKIIERLIELAKEDIDNDPTAANTKVSHYRNAKVGDRSCTHIKVIHPKPGEGIKFHEASLYIDDKLNVPIGLVVYGWPEGKGKPPLIEEYRYDKLQLNVGLTDEDFSESRLDNADGRSSVATSLSR